MNFLGWSIMRRKAAVPMLEKPQDWTSTGGWWSLARLGESVAGAWQRGITIQHDDVLAYGAVFACITLIASDVGKLYLRLVQLQDGVWVETENSAYSPVLRTPNHFQTRQQFFEQWVISKAKSGNTFVLKERDQRGVVKQLYILDPMRVKPLVAPNGDVYYEVKADALAGLDAQAVRVPASEIIHDRFNTLFHPLCGLSPLTACGLAATHGLKIQEQSARLFANGSNPGGVLTSPNFINNDTAKRIQEHWETEYAGEQNAGKVAVLGDGLNYEAMMVTPHDAQLVEQLKLTGSMVCTAFHVPDYMVGIGPPPNYNNIQALNQQYYSQCVQAYLEAIENCLDAGLSMPSHLAPEFDVEGLLRMDTTSATEAATKAIQGGLKKPNEARRTFNLPPVPGGDTVYLQQQQYSLEALNRRDQAPATDPAPMRSLRGKVDKRILEMRRAS